MDRSIEKAATTGQLQTSCNPWRMENWSQLLLRVPVSQGKSNNLLNQVTATSSVHLWFCESSRAARTAAPVNCSFCTPARVTLRRKLRQADKVTAAQVTRHWQGVPPFQLQTPSSQQGFQLTDYPVSICPPLTHMIANQFFCPFGRTFAWWTVLTWLMLYYTSRKQK